MTAEPSTDTALATNPEGVRLGRYELLGEIASGGMATVFLGRAVGARGFSRLVAIKRMHPHLERDEEFVTAFLEEARLAARIRHPNVVATLDVEDGDAPYLVMEYVEGDRLSGLIKEHVTRERQGLPLDVALRVAIDSLDGLHAAHDLRDDDGEPLDLIHRDISPQNVLVGVDGVARVTDFGIAKAAGRASHTREGELKGKIAYMAPEQLTNPGGIDRRVDVFAMGVVCWEMLTGRRLFRAATDIETIGVILHHEVSTIRSVAPHVPERVEAVVMRALERDPSKRWNSAQDFARALESLGLASPTRVVADFVKLTVGDKLLRERARLRSGWSTSTPHTSSARKPTGEVSVSEVRRTATGSIITDAAPSPANAAKTKALVVGAVSALAIVAVAIVAVIAITKKSPVQPPPVGITAGPPVQVGSNVAQGPSPAQGAAPAQGATPMQPAGGTIATNTVTADAGVAAEPSRTTPSARPTRSTRRTNRGHGEDNLDSVLMGQPIFDRPRSR